MKKVVVYLLVGGAVLPNVQADVSSFDSVYGGVGFGLNFVDNDDMTEHCNDQIPVGIGALGQDSSARKLKNKKTKRLAGSLVFGVGKTLVHGIYLGLDVGLDLTKSRSHDFEVEHSMAGVSATSGTIKNSGTSYNVGARLGLVSDKTLVYLKPSVQFNQITVNDYANTYTAGTTGTNQSGHAKKNAAFALAIGIERMMSDKGFSVRFEGEYLFPTRIKANSKTQMAAAPGTNAYQYRFESKVKRMNIRLLGVYGIKY